MASTSFKDHFSQAAHVYAQNRPSYPQSLFKYLAETVKDTGCAWDCATGNGQAALGLATYFDRVIATDASEKQIAQARPHPRIEYLKESANRAPVAETSVDLVTVAQALHWFYGDGFYKEVYRVLKPQGLVAVWTYGIFELPNNPVLMNVLHTYYTDIVGPFWPHERKHVENRYRSIPFPFTEISTPTFLMSEHWDLKRTLGYLQSWSATQSYIKHNGSNPIHLIEADLAEAWGSPDNTHIISWPLTLKVGRSR